MKQVKIKKTSAFSMSLYENSSGPRPFYHHSSSCVEWFETAVEILDLDMLLLLLFYCGMCGTRFYLLVHEKPTATILVNLRECLHCSCHTTGGSVDPSAHYHQTWSCPIYIGLKCESKEIENI
ncbi:hypothetical protein V6N13_145417 [Hibiscus sabdariffa]